MRNVLAGLLALAMAAGLPLPVASAQCNTWRKLGGGANALVDALAVFDGELIVGGEFRTAGGQSIGFGLAKWTMSGWTDFNGGLCCSPSDDAVRAMLNHSGKLYVAGQFTSIGGVAANSIARWNGTNWAALGTGTAFADEVLALSVYNNQVIAAGPFTEIGGVSCKRIARWTGSAWKKLGSGMNGPVNALTVFNGELIAGGGFTTAGSNQAWRIARWNGSTWRPLGTGINAGMDGTVEALAKFNGQLIVGGVFSNAGGATANGIARWNGSQWQPLGGGVCGMSPATGVYELQAYEDRLIAAGFFRAPNTMIAQRVASR